MLAVVLLVWVNFDVYKISGQSMQPTLREGQWVIIWRTAYGIVLPGGKKLFGQAAQINDIVLYRIKNHIVIKRCVAVSGMPLDFSPYSEYTVPSEYSMNINGKKIVLSAIEYRHLGGMTENPVVPDGMILALGDNSAYSCDSRSYGFVAQDSLYGKVVWK